MPLNFNADFRGPKIDIVTREVPIAAIEKVGDILQDRYDKSYEQYNLADEALKNMEASANPVDQEKARELRTYYNAEMQGILEKGDFHNMRHKTASLARNAALNYRIIGERNQEIQKNVDAIRKDPRYQLDPEGAVKDYLSSIKSVNINPETRTISDYTVGTYGAAADVNIPQKLLQIAPTLRSKYLKSKGSYFGTRTLPNGQKVPTIETEGGGYEILKPEEIASELKAYIQNDPEVQAYLSRDVKRLGINPQSEEGIIAYNKLLNERVNNASKALGDMYAIDKDMSQKSFTIVPDSADSKKPKPLFSQRQSNIFKVNGGTQPFKLDEKGNIIVQAPQTDDPYTLSKVGFLDEKMIGSNQQINEMKKSVENSTTYKRLVNFLTEKGTIKKGDSKKQINQAIIDYWNNQISDANSSIAVAQPGDEEANKYIAEINKSYFGTPTPDANTKGSSVLNGQLAQASFINEKGQKMSAKEIFNEIKDKNVRVTGWVNQTNSPFEYGSHYMVAVDPNSGEQKHYLIEPDINTKNSGAYFANRILNSTKKSDLKSEWRDGYGVNYEAVPLEGGSKYVLYINKDIKTPIILDNSDLDTLQNLPAGQASSQLLQYYNSIKK